MDSLPAKLRVGPYTIDVFHEEQAHAHLLAQNCWGQFIPDRYAILLRSSYPNNELAVSTFLHEFTHAAIYCYGMASEGWTEEQVCVANDLVFLGLFKDNPEVSDWIKKALK